MEITERDLFNYVFYKNTLAEDKAEYLGSTDIYKDEIDFFNSLKNTLSVETNSEIKKKIAQKIPVYDFSNLTRQTGIIVLYPVIEKSKKGKKDKGLVLATDSAELKTQQTSQTFYDEKKEYLIKLVYSESETKIFVFSTSESELKNLKLTLHPNEKEYFLKDNSNPLEVNENITAESILLEFT